MVFSVTSSYARTSIFITSNKEIVGNDFLLSIASIISWATLFLYLAFKEQMTPWSVGCKVGVVFWEERKDRLLLILQYSIWMGCTVISDECNFPVFFFKLIDKISNPIFNKRWIHPAFVLVSVTTRSIEASRNPSFSDLPMTNTGSFSSS